MAPTVALCALPLACLLAGVLTLVAKHPVVAGARDEELEDIVSRLEAGSVGDTAAKVKVMQWNILADGLSIDGFRSPKDNEDWQHFYEGTKQTVTTRDDLKKRFELADGQLNKSSCNAAKKRTDQSQLPDEVEKQAARKCEQMCLDSLTDDEKKNAKAISGKLTCFVKEMLEASTEEQFWTNLKKDQRQEGDFEKKVVAWDARFPKMAYIIGTEKPDVIVLEELDHYTDFAALLQGDYTSVCNGPYNLYETEDMLKNRLVAIKDDKKNYKNSIKALEEKKIAFAPNLNSNARKFYTRDNPTADKFKVDDQGTGIFWRKSLQCEDVKMQIHTDGDAASVSVALKKDGRAFTVVGTHLSSGPDKETRRCQELFGEPGKSGIPGKPGITKLIPSEGGNYIFAGDLNSDRFFNDWGKVKQEGKGTCKNKISSFDRVKSHNMHSIWDGGPVPATVFKMRGAGTNQPTKMGELQLETIDHIFYRGVTLVDKAYVHHPDMSPDESSLQRPFDVAWESCFMRRDRTNIIKDKFESNQEFLADEKKCFKYMLPSLDFPSDHWPVLATFEVAS